MLDGGPALWYLNRLRHNSANAILLTGYQAEGSGGRRLVEEGRIPIFGRLTPVSLEIDKFDLSNHGDHAALTSFARACSPSDLVVFHATEVGRKALHDEFAGETRVHLPTNNAPILIGA
jgi:putative mRNA 3-end processing factor